MTQVLNTISPPATAPLRAALTEATRRCGFSPEALEALDLTIDDVYRELVDDGVADDRTLRTRLARKLIAFACNGVGDIQAKQLLLRTSAMKFWPPPMPVTSPRSRGRRLRGALHQQMNVISAGALARRRATRHTLAGLS